MKRKLVQKTLFILSRGVIVYALRDSEYKLVVDKEKLQRLSGTVTQVRRSVASEQFQRISLKIPSTENVGSRRIFWEAPGNEFRDAVLEKETRWFAGTSRITAVKLDTHYIPIKLPRRVRHRQSDRSLCQSSGPSTLDSVGSTRDHEVGIGNFWGSDLFKDHFPSFSARQRTRERGKLG